MQVPTSWKSVTISQYQRLYNVVEEKESYSDIIDYYVDMIKTVTDATEEDILSLPRAEFFIKVKTLNDLVTSKPEFPFPKFIILSGRVFRFKQNISKFTGGQFIDFSMQSKAADIKQMTANLHNIIAALAFDVWGKYDGKALIDRGKFLQRHCTMNVAFALCAFFLTITRISYPHIHRSLNRQMRRNIMKNLS